MEWPAHPPLVGGGGVSKHLHKIANGQTNFIKIIVFRANYNKVGFNLEF